MVLTQKIDLRGFSFCPVLSSSFDVVFMPPYCIEKRPLVKLSQAIWLFAGEAIRNPTLVRVASLLNW
jgi:hypothetical protein